MSRNPNLLVLLLGVLLLAEGSQASERTERAEAERPPAVLATVNGEPILAADVEKRLGRIHGAAAEGQRSGFSLDSLLFQMVNDVLLGQEARALEMDREAAIRRKVEAFRRDLARKHLERLEVAEYARPTDEEVRQVFEEQYRRVTFRVVTAYEQKGAEELLGELRAGADLVELAMQRSVDPYRLRGGLVENIPRIDLQREIGDLVFSLDPGVTAGPVRTDLGWSVVRVDSFEKADPERFSALQGRLEALVSQRKAAARRSVLAPELKAKHAVRIDEEAVAEIEPERLPDGRLIPKTPNPESVVVRIGDKEKILASEYGQALLVRWKRVRNLEAATAAAPIILQKVIEERLLTAEALARGYAQLPEVERAVHAYETQQLISPFLKEVVAAGITVSEEEMRSYYEEHREELHRPPRVRLGQISVGSMEESKRLEESLRKGGDLAWLAERHSVDDYRDKGGDRGWVVPQPGVEGFHAQLFEAQIGEVLEPMRIGDVFVVTKVTGREDQGVYPFEEISGNIREKVFAEKFGQALDRFMSTLRNRSTIEIDDELLASLSVEGSVEDESHGGEESGDRHQ
ncbi:MAG: hypothetical protein GY769_25530 [bacterium]|nr:hypothetical protein [bacterium]